MIIKYMPEDFIVQEVLVTEFSSRDSEQAYMFLCLDKKGISTFDAIAAIESWFPVSDCTAAGLKDSDGVTSQKISIPIRYRGILNRIDEFNRENANEKRFLRLTFLGYSNEPLKPARLEGNVFRLRLRGMDSAKAESMMKRQIYTLIFMLEPWIKMDAARRTSWQELSLRLSALAGYQRDRAHFEDLMLPVGGDLILTARRWGVELQNETYVGDNLLPLRGLANPAGGVYGTDLYFRSPCYDGFYDRVQLAWLPRLNHYLTLRLAVRAHFGREGFLGWQQQFSLRLSLDALRHRDTLAGRCL